MLYVDSHGLPSAVMIVDGIGIGDSKLNLFLMSMLSSIASKEMNGKDCYYIRGMGWETYIDKETGLIVRAYSGTEVKETGEETKMY